MASIFAQVQGDEIGTRLFGQQGSRDRIGVGRMALLTERRDVVNIDTEIDHSGATCSVFRTKSSARRFGSELTLSLTNVACR